MPILHVHMLAGRDVEKKRLLAKRLTETVQEVLGSPPEKIRIILSDMPHDSYAVAGVLYSDEEKS
ncbi:MAG: 2-hydroxymuconate tautomerase [Alphaproteobacteria bacterium]|nr:2-hydroxymuconate tautomerase [Alphaproteobacteria bacterium]